MESGASLCQTISGYLALPGTFSDAWMDSQHISSSESCLERHVHSGVHIWSFPIAGIPLSSRATCSIVKARTWPESMESRTGTVRMPSYTCSVAGVDAAFIRYAI